MHLISFLFVLLLSHLVYASPQTCYWPNKVVSPTHRPCNESANESHCCGPDDFCLDNGLCYDTAGTISQQSCTDPTWDASDCFQLCKEARSGLPIMPTGLFVDLTQGIRLFCCDIGTYNSANDTCDYGDKPTSPFGLSFGKVITDRSTGSTEVFNSTHKQDPSSTANSTESATTQTVTITASGNGNGAATPQSHTSTYAAIGAGVGAPLALALLGVSYLLYREKRKNTANNPAKYTGSSDEDRRAWVAQLQQQQRYQQTQTQNQTQYAHVAESPENYSAPHHAHPQLTSSPTELDATRVGELDGRNSRWVDGVVRTEK
ncbi:hypothetical protein BU16DRAFT_534667 [Lophium mytilinum]|uniref:Mid2 domain-containing protein n=1 Tax=Lophium mytilinum TaxID=390894 RepID=A0A6A6R6K0_9PEZI|nr:hypothetical protein BU16DRAFT_534667 [Lophium mytilinum]